MPNTIINRRVIFNGGSSASGSYTAIMTDYLARLSLEGGTLTDVEKGYLNTLTLNSDINEFDRLWIHGLSNRVAARISLVNALSSDLITEVNAPTWDSFGYTGNGTTMYLDANYNPYVDGVKFTQNSASFGNYLLINGIVESSILMGVNDATSLTYHSPVFLGLGSALWTVNNLGGNSTGASLSSDGFYSIGRIGVNESHYYRNGVDTYSDLVIPSTTPANLNFYILCRNNNGTPGNFTTNKLSVSFIGSGAINQSQFYTDIQALGTNLGWAV